MNSLNKPFWDDLEVTAPKAVRLFKDWIDEYKKEVGWNLLFNDGIIKTGSSFEYTKAPKFHDLPIEMQEGVIKKFLREKEISVEIEIIGDNHFFSVYKYKEGVTVFESGRNPDHNSALIAAIQESFLILNK